MAKARLDLGRLIPGVEVEPNVLTAKMTVRPVHQVLKPNGDNGLAAQEMIEWE